MLKNDQRMKPLWHLVSPPIALILTSATKLLEFTARTTVADSRSQKNRPTVYINWHQHLPCVMTYHGKFRDRYIMIQQNPYMEPIVAWARMIGMEVTRGGGKGQGSSSAMAELKDVLQRGVGSAVLAVDGPAGPHLTMKRGCYDLAKETGSPIVLVSYTLQKGRADSSRWDQRLFPRPFDTVAFTLSKEYWAKDKSFDELSSEIEGDYRESIAGLAAASAKSAV